MALVLILLICVLIMFSAFFSASEITYAKANRFRIDKAAEEGVPVLGSSKTSYELAGEMYALGLGNPVK